MKKLLFVVIAILMAKGNVVKAQQYKIVPKKILNSEEATYFSDLFFGGMAKEIEVYDIKNDGFGNFDVAKSGEHIVVLDHLSDEMVDLMQQWRLPRNKNLVGCVSSNSVEDLQAAEQFAQIVKQHFTGRSLTIYIDYSKGSMSRTVIGWGDVDKLACINVNWNYEDPIGKKEKKIFKNKWDYELSFVLMKELTGKMREKFIEFFSFDERSAIYLLSFDPRKFGEHTYIIANRKIYSISNFVGGLQRELNKLNKDLPIFVGSSLKINTVSYSPKLYQNIAYREYTKKPGYRDLSDVGQIGLLFNSIYWGDELTLVLKINANTISSISYFGKLNGFKKRHIVVE